ncbi:MAG: hemerythrin domain-containing protein [Egibacteraceae bacterium]
MDALRLLIDDHDKVRALFRQFESAQERGDTSMMDDATAEVITELKVHTAIEEKVFYPAVRAEGSDELGEIVREGIEEHHVVDMLIEGIESLDASDEAFVAKMTVLIENVEHHAGEEENEMFPKASAALGMDRLNTLGARLEEAKRQAIIDSLAKEKLYEQAKAQGIVGRSTMTKEELAKALGQV